MSQIMFWRFDHVLDFGVFCGVFLVLGALCGARGMFKIQ
jgi:hypothetical protein